MRTISSVVVLAMVGGVVQAQPAPAPQTYPPQQSGGWPGGPGAPPQQPYYGPQQPMQVQLTVDEQWLLERGYISDGEQIGGGLVALMFGFGLGQAVQGRWGDKGWIFTLGEGVSIAAMFYGLIQAVDCVDGSGRSCNGDQGAGIAVAGILGFTVFRVWETVDAFAAPSAHNRKVRALRARLGMPVDMYSRLTPYLTPSRDRDGGTAGISLRF